MDNTKAHFYRKSIIESLLMKIILSFSLVLQHCIHFYHNQIIKRYNRIF